MEKNVVLLVAFVFGLGIAAVATNFLDQGQMQERYDAGYIAGHTSGINAWPELRGEFRKTGVCDWARYMVISKTCTKEDFK